MSSDVGAFESAFSDFLNLTLNHGVGSVEGGGPLIPFVLTESRDSARSDGLRSNDLRTPSRLHSHSRLRRRAGPNSWRSPLMDF